VESYGRDGTVAPSSQREALFVARPSRERDMMKESIRGRFWHSDLAKLRDEAFALFQRFASS
ncbi:MAG: hypothetical protein M3O95_09345, partial [Candidatus Dormibacteraeota bacterium]|nr:hypothetical protein [Candidatus Dormibacteraeota bacterium]